MPEFDARGIRSSPLLRLLKVDKQQSNDRKHNCFKKQVQLRKITVHHDTTFSRATHYGSEKKLSARSICTYYDAALSARWQTSNVSVITTDDGRPTTDVPELEIDHTEI